MLEALDRAVSSTWASACETAIELSYRAPISDWLTLQPDVQYVIHPSTDAARDDAWVFGLRVELALP